jgi:hypothetical protein
VLIYWFVPLNVRTPPPPVADKVVKLGLFSKVPCLPLPLKSFKLGPEPE